MKTFHAVKKMEVLMKQKRMALCALSALLILTFVAVGFSKDKPVESQWVATPASIDGMNTEWGNTPFYTQKKVEVDYAFMNDAENLFVFFIFKNPKYLSSIGWTGMTIWLSPQGEKDKDLGIRFVKKEISADDYIALLEEQTGKPVSDQDKGKIRQHKAYMLFEQELINKKAPDYSGDAPRPRFMGAIFRSNNVEKTVIYEFSFSLARLAEAAPQIGIEPGKGLSLNFEWGGATKEYKEALASGLAARDTSARDDRPTGSLTSERGGGEGLGNLETDSSNLARMRRQLQQVKKYDFWVELILAQNK
jgi:hypothetical protein